MAINIAKIGSTIVSTAKTFSGKPLGVASKVLGVATVASVIYDSHINGRENSYTKDEVLSADRYLNLYKQYVTSPSKSATVSKMKKDWFMSQQTNSYFHFFTKTKAYAREFLGTLGVNLPKIALSALTLLSIKNKNKAVSTLGKAAGCILGASWGKTILFDVLGIGAKKIDREY